MPQTEAQRAARKRYYERHLEKCRAQSRAIMSKQVNRDRRRVRRWIEHGIDITLEQYYFLREVQHNRCAICGRESNALQVDHHHESGKVRGLLCRKCNFGIGYFDEEIESLLEAVRYLERHAVTF